MTDLIHQSKSGQLEAASDKVLSASTIAFMYLCAIGYAFGWNSTHYLISEESFPLRIRTLGTSVVMIVHLANRYGLQKAVPCMALKDALQPSGKFWLFAAVTLLSLVWVRSIIPKWAVLRLKDATALSSSKQAKEEVEP